MTDRPETLVEAIRRNVGSLSEQADAAVTYLAAIRALVGMLDETRRAAFIVEMRSALMKAESGALSLAISDVLSVAEG